MADLVLPSWELFQLVGYCPTSHTTHAQHDAPVHTETMSSESLAEADRVLAELSPGKREAVREIVIDTIRRGCLDPRARRYLATVSGSELVGNVLDAVVGEQWAARPSAAIEQPSVSRLHVGPAGELTRPDPRG
ncbi:hypothetical protein GCM10017690_14870 [Microbacterium terregens]